MKIMFCTAEFHMNTKHLEKLGHKSGTRSEFRFLQEKETSFTNSLSHVIDRRCNSQLPNFCTLYRRLSWEFLSGVEQKYEFSVFFFQYSYMFLWHSCLNAHENCILNMSKQKLNLKEWSHSVWVRAWPILLKNISVRVSSICQHAFKQSYSDWCLKWKVVFSKITQCRHSPRKSSHTQSPI